jgi:L-seryl-tRNA(Ser) seleniumtransferase
VDAAGARPPAANLRRFIAVGADLVAFSGGKAIGGPQASGILCGRRDLVAAAALQQLDLDVTPATWRPPPGLIPRDALPGVPRHGLGRGFKVGKEEIAGLVVALQRFVARDVAAELARHEARLTAIASHLAGLPGVTTRLRPARETGRFPLLDVILDPGVPGRGALAVSEALQAGDPPVHLGERRTAEGILIVHPEGLRDGDEAIVAHRLRAVLGAALASPKR